MEKQKGVLKSSFFFNRHKGRKKKATFQKLTHFDRQKQKCKNAKGSEGRANTPLEMLR